MWPRGVLDPTALPQSRRLQLTQDALDEGGIVTTPAAVQERDNLAGGQPLPELGSGGCRQNRQGGPVLEVGKGPQRLRVELQQDRPQLAGGLVQRPDRLLVLARQRLDRQALIADHRQRPVPMTIGPQHVGQHRRVTQVGLLARLAVPLAVAGDRTRIDGVDG